MLKPGGRLVVGEGQPDPHMVRLADLRRRAAAVGLRFEEHAGGGLGYLARLRAPSAAVASAASRPSRPFPTQGGARQ